MTRAVKVIDSNMVTENTDQLKLQVSVIDMLEAATAFFPQYIEPVYASRMLFWSTICLEAVVDRLYDGIAPVNT